MRQPPNRIVAAADGTRPSDVGSWNGLGVMLRDRRRSRSSRPISA